MNDEWLRFALEDFVNILGTQQAFLELSRFLLSNKPYIEEVSNVGSHFVTVSEITFSLIRDNIRNEDLQEMMGRLGWRIDPDMKRPVYEWMQANYGNYEIRRIW